MSLNNLTLWNQVDNLQKQFRRDPSVAPVDKAFTVCHHKTIFFIHAKYRGVRARLKKI